MNRSNTLTLALVPILVAAACLGGCKKQEAPPATMPATESASSPDMASSVSGAGAMAASGAMASSAASQ